MKRGDCVGTPDDPIVRVKSDSIGNMVIKQGQARKEHRQGQDVCSMVGKHYQIASDRCALNC